MFSRKCPSCSQDLTFKQISQYIKEEAIDCPYCRARLRIKTFDSLTNSFLVGALAGIIAGTFHLPMLNSMLVGALAAIVFRKYIDVFFSLEVDDSPEF